MKRALSLQKRKRMQYGQFAGLEKGLHVWYQRKQSSNIPLTSNMLQEKALSLIALLNFTQEFETSVGWLRGFKQRHSIVGRTICGESNALDDVTVEHSKDSFLY